MKQTMTFWISKRIAKCWGTRAAAVFGWLFAQCQAQVPRDECKLVGLARVYRKSVRVKVSCTQLGKLLHLSRHTVEAILHRFEADGIINVWLPRGEDRTRSYSIAPAGFTLLHRWAGEWHVNAEELLFCWGLDTRVASRVGVNAAIVFQHLWHWSTAYRWGSHYSKGGRAWLPCTAAEIARWLPFLSDDVVEAALHTLQAEGLLEKMRQGRVTKWAVSDAGFTAMGEVPPVQYEARAHTGVAAVAGSVAWTAAVAAGTHTARRETWARGGTEANTGEAGAQQAHEARRAAWARHCTHGRGSWGSSYGCEGARRAAWVRDSTEHMGDVAQGGGIVATSYSALARGRLSEKSVETDSKHHI